MAVEIPHRPERRRPARLYSLILWNQKSPLLQIVALDRPVIAVITHRIVLQWSDPISELVNMHNCEEAIQLLSPKKEGWIASSLRSSQCRGSVRSDDGG
jgi:hypothetical protein